MVHRQRGLDDEETVRPKSGIASQSEQLGVKSQCPSGRGDHKSGVFVWSALVDQCYYQVKTIRPCDREGEVKMTVGKPHRDSVERSARTPLGSAGGQLHDDFIPVGVLIGDCVLIGDRL